MAFQYFTEQKIKLIDVENIPPEFQNFYDKQSDQRKKEIKALRPDLIRALFPLETENDNTEKTENTIIDEWENMSTLAWRRDIIDATVLVCKVIPNGLIRCPIHRKTLSKKQLKYRNAEGGVFNISGIFCPDCMDFFIEKNKIEKIAKNAAERGIPAWIQPYEMTMAEWDAAIIPLEINDETPVYYTDSWGNGKSKCPLHANITLIAERYKRVYKDRRIIFNAKICSRCNKTIMDKADALKLEANCRKTGIPEINFIPLVADQSTDDTGRPQIVPDFIIEKGKKYSNPSKKASNAEKLSEKNIIIVGFSEVCAADGHETLDDEVIIDVQTKTAGIRHCLTSLGYCIHCKKHYLEQDSYLRMIEIGSPEVTIIDETKDESEQTIRSGSSFIQEKEHLRCLENDLTQYVANIKAKPDYIEKYATLSYGYDEGDLKWRKYKSEPYYQEIARITALRPKPYGYRVDFASGKKTIEYYLGIDDINIDGENRVLSFNSKEGRKLVNYRTSSIEKDGKRWAVNKRREFDIVRENLFGFTEYTAGIHSLTSSITDPFLIAVLKKRRSQHQLVEIISTIQENQDQIIDEPLQKNLIVQGCAGSGKTMVLLHRLSALKYENEKRFDFSKTIILTPNKNFNTHIDGLAESLQIGVILRQSVEDYYNSLLNEYSPALVIGSNISDEMNLDQGYVDYLYSDEFFKLFSAEYENMLQRLKGFLNDINTLSLQFDRKQVTEVPEGAENLLDVIEQALTDNRERMQQKEKEYESCQKRLSELSKKYERTAELIEFHKLRFHSSFLPETLAAGAKLSQALDETKSKLQASEDELARAFASRETLLSSATKAASDLEEAFRLTMEKIEKEINGNAKNSAERLKQIKEELSVNTEEQKRINRERIIADAQLETTIDAYRNECLDLLKEEETALKRNRTQINQQLADKREEYANIERRILISRKTERLRGIQREIDALEQERKHLNDELDEINQFILYNSIYTGRKDFYSSLSQIKSIIPQVAEIEAELNQSESKITQLELALKEAEKASVQLQQEATNIERETEELKTRLPKIQQQPTPDTFPEYLKAVQGLITDPKSYLDELRPIRQASKQANEALDDCSATIMKAEEECAKCKNRYNTLEQVSKKLPENITEENCIEYISTILPVLPSVKENLNNLSTKWNNLRNSREALPLIKEDLDKAKENLELADKNRFSSDLEEQLKNLEEEQKKLNPKSIYNEIFSSAIGAAGKRLGNWFLGAISRARGVYRYDLYLRLRFAMEFFGKSVGEDKLICIDEGQDLALNEFILIRDINKGQAIFNIYGDTNQLLKENRGISDWEPVRQLFNTSVLHRLNENYRNTNQITQYCNEAFDMHVTLTGVDGHEVNQIDRDELEKVLSAIEPGENRYALILPRSVNKEQYLHLEQLPEQIREIIGYTIEKGRIAIVYVDEIKGIEFDVVFAVQNGMTKNEKYIAFTRALSELSVVTDKTIPPPGIDSALSEIGTAQESGDSELATYDGIVIGKVIKKNKSITPNT